LEVQRHGRENFSVPFPCLLDLTLLRGKHGGGCPRAATKPTEGCARTVLKKKRKTTNEVTLLESLTPDVIHSGREGSRRVMFQPRDPAPGFLKNSAS
jgi:hypothetical protein